MIAVRSGHNNSLEEIQEMYIDGHASKEDYTQKHYDPIPIKNT